MDKESAARLQEIAEHISATERKAMVAERDAKDRYIAAYLADRVGAVFDARITGVTNFGLFITLGRNRRRRPHPARNLGHEYFAYDEKNRALVGTESGDTYRFGRPVKAKLEEATPITGGLTFEMVSKPEKGKPPKRNHRGGSAHKSRGAKHKRKRR